MGHSLTGLENPDESIRIQRIINHILGRYHTAGPSWPSHSQRTVFIVQELSPFNVILGRTWLHYMKAIPSTYHQMTRPQRLGVSPGEKRVIRNEIDKLLEAGFIREVSYPDCFPLPRIDQIVDSTSGQGMLSFLDAFSGYHQIPMSPDDEEKTAFITPHGLYCYKVMPFGLKNAGATYQRLMTKIFKPLIGHSVEVYIDDIVVKSKTREQHILHLQEVFHLLRNQRGIEVSPDQVKAVMETPPPRNKKELQRLTGKLVALGRFIARFTDELRPFFLAIRKAGAHGWTDSCQNALEKIKHCHATTHLEQPHPKGEIIHVSGGIRMGNQRRSIPLPLTQGAETYLLCQQGIGRRRNQIFKNGANSLSPSKRCPKLRPIFKPPVINIPEAQPHDESSKKNGGLCELTEPHAHQALELGSYYSPQLGNIWSKPSGWDSLPLTMKQNMRHLVRIGPRPCSIRLQTPDLQRLTTRGTQSPGASCPFHLDWGHLYKRSFTGPYLRCLGHSEAQYVLAELHEGICGNHSGGRSLAHRAHSQGYYWPTMKKDAAAYVKNVINVKVGPLPAAPAQKKFLLVATDYFSKWVEAEAYASIKDKDVTKFVWKNIICRFGIPQTIIADNGPQFDSIAFRNFCSELNIRNSYSTPRYPQSNGQAEATNKTLITALKKRLEQAKGKWVEELPGVLWAYRTTPGRPTGNTPFALAYGMDAVIPTK
ncbi:Transposon Ty3-I Gag-Pol polyprotein [Vitis vinifera]|uniref:Transposon Ty3-I Gag-Pol polyprotein n=1 Tax=Vitis vinifera TaxID=29760 RepID=A0A438FER9_VITVI|nr:Transposon Ty3-I Gag-Pol polyprotein [Vitis vinifera]